jgi:hypothetical protein
VGGDNIDLSGTRGGDGAVVMTGVRRPAIPEDHQIEVSELRLTHGETGLSGNFAYRLRSPVAVEWPFVELRQSGPIVSAIRIGDLSPADTSFTGTWTGHAVLRDCSSIDRYPCSPLELRETLSVRLIVSGTGGRVTGLFEKPVGAAIEGTISGSTVLIQGVSHDVNDSRTLITRVRPSTLTRDALGRLRGSLSMEMHWQYNDGRVSSSDFRAIELLDVLLSPPS